MQGLQLGFLAQISTKNTSAGRHFCSPGRVFFGIRTDLAQSFSAQRTRPRPREQAKVRIPPSTSPPRTAKKGRDTLLDVPPLCKQRYGSCSAAALSALPEIGPQAAHLGGIFRHGLLGGLEHIITVVGGGLAQRPCLALGGGRGSRTHAAVPP